MSKKRTPMGKFIHTKWTNLNIRAGKYRHLQNKDKNKAYQNITVEFTRLEFKEWCYHNEELILSMKRPSIDRIDSSKNYSLDNIQIIELTENISKKKYGNKYHNGPLKNTKRGIRKQGNKYLARISIKNVEYNLGYYDNEEDAYNAFYEAFVKHYNFTPW